MEMQMCLYTRKCGRRRKDLILRFEKDIVLLLNINENSIGEAVFLFTFDKRSALVHGFTVMVRTSWG